MRRSSLLKQSGGHQFLAFLPLGHIPLVVTEGVDNALWRLDPSFVAEGMHVVPTSHQLDFIEDRASTPMRTLTVPGWLLLGSQVTNGSSTLFYVHTTKDILVYKKDYS